VLVIPAFAIGRAMELVYMFRTLEDRGTIPAVPIILDSPMASAALTVSLRHDEDHSLNSAFLAQKDAFEAFKPKYFEISTSSDESMASCMRDGPMVIVSASGMLSGGRILHHLKARLPDAKNTMIFAGYQAEGSKGRWLQDFVMGKQSGVFRIHHKEVEVEAEIVTMDELSAHADYQDMMEWLGGLRKAPELTIINHGSEEAQIAMRDRIKKELGWQVVTAFEQRHTPLWDIKGASR
jgi:metallo-beta-lactamase family protein